MPTYEYACQDCGQHLEVVQSFSDGPLTTCGACGGTLRKVFHPTGILFKGSGFYSTDNRKGSPTPGDGKEGKGKGSGEAKADPGKGTSGSPEASTSTSPAKEKSA